MARGRLRIKGWAPLAADRREQASVPGRSSSPDAAENAVRPRLSLARVLILANEHGPGFELATWRALVARKALQEPQAVAITRGPQVKTCGSFASSWLPTFSEGGASENPGAVQPEPFPQT